MYTKLPYAVAWFAFEETRMVELVIRTMQELRIPELRTAFSWADWERPGGREWFDHVVERFRDAEIRLMPCLFYTPLEKARTLPGDEPHSSYPPKRLEDYADFAEEMIGRYGDAFEWIQFWNEPNWDVYWSWKMDPTWQRFADMVRGAIAVARTHEKKIVLGGLSPYEPKWVDAMFAYGILPQADALGIHAFPGTWDEEESPRRKDRPWPGFEKEVADARAQLRAHGSSAEVWFTETGYSTFGSGALREMRERNQIAYFEEIRRCPADRVYWHAVVDQPTGSPTDNELNAALVRDDKAYHFGIVGEHGEKKPLFTHWRNIARN